MPTTFSSPINAWLVENKILAKDNPAVSPDLTLDFPRLLDEITHDSIALLSKIRCIDKNKLVLRLDKIIVWNRSEFSGGDCCFVLVESIATGDCALVSEGECGEAFIGGQLIGDRLSVIPLYWDNLIALKNLVQENDPDSTIFPTASDTLSRTSLGIGARFTTLHWPAVAWAMKYLGVPLTANQNSIPRELVYNVDAMLENELAEIPFPFIGGNVPEGHQGQSVQGMSHASVITYLKYGFHTNKIAWGFNADHQPIGGRFSDIEQELVDGSLFASYITYDLSPELSENRMIDNEKELDIALKKEVGIAAYKDILARLKQACIAINEYDVKRLVVYLMPAMLKMKRRDTLYTAVREAHFTTEIGRKFHKELSIDELPGETSALAMAVALAMAESMDIRFQFIAPNIGFQKNFPYDDNNALASRIKYLYDVASRFGVSIGFHSGSGKSAENYKICGDHTNRHFEVKTSGRYTFEMGAALAQSKNKADQALWHEWYAFAKELAIKGAFSDNEKQRDFARQFVSHALSHENKPIQGVFSSHESLAAALDMLNPSPEHMFWFEYNFLFVLAGNGSIDRLGDHSPEGYAQRKRFYTISDEGKLLFVKNVALYIIFLAQSTGIVDKQKADEARTKISSYCEYETMLDDIAK